MNGEIKRFKRELGGFSRRDVIEYISSLAEERNAYLSAKEDAEAEIQKLSEAIEALRADLDDSARRIKEVRVSALDDAAKAFSELEEAYGNVCSDVEATAAHVRSQLIKAGDSVSLMSSILEKVGRRFSELRTIVDVERLGAAREARGTGELPGDTGPIEDSDTPADSEPYTDLAL